MKAPEILAAARGELEERAAAYDAPEGERSVPAVVAAFNAITGHQLTEADGWRFLVLLKLVRGRAAPGFHRDSAVDAAGYTALLGEAMARQGTGV